MTPVDLSEFVKRARMQSCRPGETRPEAIIEALRPDLEELLALRAAGCPHVVTGDEGTSHCALAESGTAALLERLQNGEGELRAENERLRVKERLADDLAEGLEIVGSIDRLKAAQATVFLARYRTLTTPEQAPPSPIGKLGRSNYFKVMPQQEGT